MNIRLPNSLETYPGSVTGTTGLLRRTNSRARLIIGIVALLLALFVAFVIYRIYTTPEPHVQVPPVYVAQVQRANVVAQERTIGTVVANATVNVTAQVGGRLDSAAFTEGQIVHQGDVLFRLDPRPFQAALAQAQATMARDQASLVSARNDAVRYSTLVKLGAASAQQRDNAVAQAGALAATVKADKANVDLAALNQQYAIIRAPVTGKTGPILVQPGNLVVANATSPLVTIVQVQPVKVSFTLPQSDIARIQDRMKAHTLTVAVAIHGERESTITAPVDFVGNQVSAGTGTVELRATFANDDYRLVPGQLVDVQVALSDFENVLTIPHDAVNQGPDGPYVYTVDAADKAQMVPVTVLNDDGTTDAVKGKLEPGERVVTDGQLRVKPGKPVAVQQPAQSAPAQRAHR
ncbi:MAG TPA: efflux RND transporter periplasmic adaptor subunit [Rhizomicrobium sp.]|nr:efflux RND transporter periplasmic adaptor subunit [Rhizomicrobium sp.]